MTFILIVFYCDLIIVIMAQAGAVDPNLGAILQQQHQHQQAELQAAAARATRERERREAEIIYQQERERITPCDGASSLPVREWLREIAGSVPYFPAGQVNALAHRLIASTARGLLRSEYDTFMDAQPNRANVQHGAVTLHLANEFLGADETATLREELKRYKQLEREEVPAFTRRFKRQAEYAYPQAQRNPDVESELSDMYMAGLGDGRVKDSCFEADPPVLTLAAAMNHAAAEHTRQKRRQRVTRHHLGNVAEQMEIAALVAAPLRDEMGKLARELTALRKEFAAMKSAGQSRFQAKPPANTTSAESKQWPRGQNPTYGPPRNGSAGTRNCYECNSPDHFRRNCPVRRARLARDLPRVPPKPGETNRGHIYIAPATSPSMVEPRQPGLFKFSGYRGVQEFVTVGCGSSHQQA